MCEMLKVSESGFYAWRKRDHSTRENTKQDLLEMIRQIQLKTKQTYGAKRVYKALKALGQPCSKKTVERLMKEYNLQAKTKRKFKATTNSKHDLPVAENIVNREFSVGKPNETWCSDITYIWTHEGWLYLAAIIDAGTRKIVGWSMGERMTQELAINALEMAVKRNKPEFGLRHQSDRGSQYASKAYQQKLWSYGMICSMSRKGNCWDNSVIESFFHTLKTECVHFENYKTREQAKASVFEYIETFYNRIRIHSSLGFVSPLCYETAALEKYA